MPQIRKWKIKGKDRFVIVSDLRVIGPHRGHAKVSSALKWTHLSRITNRDDVKKWLGEEKKKKKLRKVM